MGSWWFKKTDMSAEPNPTTPYLTVGVDTADGKLKSKTSAGVLTTYLDSSTSLVPPTRLINTTAPLAGGGDLSADRTLSITAATPSAAGSLSAADKTTINALPSVSVGTTRLINTTAPLTGGGALSSDLTLGLATSGVVYAKLQNETGLTFLGNPTASAAAPSEITLGGAFQFVGTALGLADNGIPGIKVVPASSALSGSMSAADKVKLDAIVKNTTATATALTTVETVVLQLPIPANFLHVGNIFRYIMAAHPAASTVLTVRIRVGPAGTIADPSVIIMSATALTNAGTRTLFGISGVNVIGASATHIGAGDETVGAIPATGTAAAATGTFNSTVANFVSVTIQNTTSTTTTVFGGVLEIL